LSFSTNGCVVWSAELVTDNEFAGSNLISGYCVPVPTLRPISPGSVNEYLQKLGSKCGYCAIH